MKKQVIKERIYTIHWYANGFCYRTTMGCTKQYVENCRNVAKQLGERVKVELEKIITYTV